MKKIVITGHKRGIGKYIYDYFNYNNNIINGYSLSNGHDISDNNTRREIILDCIDSDIFVNNAYKDHDDSQLYLLKEVGNLWKNTNKIIINISSTNTNLENKYGLRKKQLDETCCDLLKCDIRVINLKPGYVKTDRVRNIKDKKMDPQEVIKILDYILKSKINIQEIKFKSF